MDREEALGGLIDYFKGNQWQTVVGALKELDTAHAHVYGDTCLHPSSLLHIIRAYFRAKDMEVTRTQDFFGGAKGWIGHIFPKGSRGKLDFYYHLDIDVAGIVASKTIGEDGKNLVIWRGIDINYVMGKFPWRMAEPEEEAEVRKYFEESEQWKKACEMVLDMKIGHFHVNVETSVRPEVIAKFAREAMEAKGWRIEDMRNMLYRLATDTAKITIPLSYPVECEFDIGWWFNPDVVLKPKEDQPFLGPILVDGLEKNIRDATRCTRKEIFPLVLSDEDIKRVVEAVT